MRSALVFLILSLPICAWGLEINSDSFTPGGKIPIEYTCDSVNISPPLGWSDIPSDTKSFVLICDDPDAPSGIWSHWIIFNIPKEKTNLSQDIAKIGALGDGTVQGINDFGNVGYGGPCPPPGKPHRYFFKLYALDTVLALGENATRDDILRAIKVHIIAEAETFGIYGR
jgi:Raf kinase inhibitor-like YbhB/YbcL family protein